jgi:hypothetical protein
VTKDDFTKAQQAFWSERCQSRIDVNNALWLEVARLALAGDPKPLQERVALIGALAPKAEAS